MGTHDIAVLAGKKLKSLRKEKGYSLREMALLIDKSEQQLFRYERGVNKIGLDTVFNYLKVLNVNCDVFFASLHHEIQQDTQKSEDISIPYPHQENKKKVVLL